MTDGYTILSAHYANEDGTAVIIMTRESGAVAISEKDRPDLWAKLKNSGLAINDMARLSAADALNRAIREALRKVDTIARRRSLRTSPEMDRVFARKSQERMAYLSAVQMQAEITRDAFPMLAASIGVEVPETGNDAVDIAAVVAIVGRREAETAQADAAIERHRMFTIRAIESAQTVEQVQAAIVAFEAK